MDFNQKFTEHVDLLLKEREVIFDSEIKALMNRAAADHTLGDGNHLLKITRLCFAQTEISVNLLVSTATEMIDVYEYRTPVENIWKLVATYIDVLVELSEEKKLKAMKISQSNTLNEILIAAVSLDDKYELLRSESKFDLDKKYTKVLKDRGKTLQLRFIYYFQNNLAYVFLFFLGGAILLFLSNLQ